MFIYLVSAFMFAYDVCLFEVSMMDSLLRKSCSISSSAHVLCLVPYLDVSNHFPFDVVGRMRVPDCMTEPCHEKTCLRGLRPVRLKPDCPADETS